MLALEPHDWFWATWRDLDPLPHPPQQPYEPQALLQQLDKIRRSKGRPLWDWSKAGLHLGMSRPEAHFWLAMITAAARTPNLIPPEILRPNPDLYSGDVTVSDLETYLAQYRSHYEFSFIQIPLMVLFPLEHWLHRLQHGHSITAFRRHILPYLTREERAALRSRLQHPLSQTVWPTPQQYSRLQPTILLAACLGLHTELYQGVTTWKASDFAAARNPRWLSAQEIIFGLGRPDDVVAQMRRLNLHLENEAHVRAWLAHTELSELALITESILCHTQPHVARQMVKAFGLAETPAVTVPMMRILHESKAGQVAQNWLAERPDMAIPSLIPLAQQRGNLAAAAQEQLRQFARRGYDTLIREQSDPIWYTRFMAKGGESGAPFATATTPEWLQEAINALGKIKMPSLTWLDPITLPAPVIGLYPLNPEQVKAVLWALRHPSTPGQTLLNCLRQQATPSSRDDFAWQLLEKWQLNNGPRRDQWAIGAILHLGSDNLLTRLNQRLREWANNRQDRLLLMGLDVLKEMDSDGALLQLFHLTHALPRQNQRRKAQERLMLAAAARHLTLEELGDRMVPGSGLDAQGQFHLEVGSRRFAFVMGPNMTPFLRDEQGRKHKSLPPLHPGENPSQVAQAKATWKHFRQELNQLTQVQTARLERAMVDERRWTWAQFEQYFLHHPFLRYLAQYLIWGVFPQPEAEQTVSALFRSADPVAAARALLPRRFSKRTWQPHPTVLPLCTFRVNEDFTFTNADDQALEQTALNTPTTHIGLVHPCHLSAERLMGWGQLLHDYDIAAPFAQCGRETYPLSPEEQTQKLLNRLINRRANPMAFRHTLHRRGWDENILPQTYSSYARFFPQAELVAVIRTDYDRANGDFRQRTISQVYFIRGDNLEANSAEHALPLHHIPPLITSEVIRDVTLITL